MECTISSNPHGTAKIVSVVKGRILDVIVGIGKKYNSANRGKIFSVELSDNNAKSLYVPDGYAHGFLVLSRRSDSRLSSNKSF